MTYDLEVRDLKVNPDERGHIVEVYGEDWDEYDISPEMTYPGIILLGTAISRVKLTTSSTQRTASKSAFTTTERTLPPKTNSIRSSSMNTVSR
jgi:hypothetical protein